MPIIKLLNQILRNSNALQKIKNIVNDKKHICCNFPLMISYQTFFFRHFVTLNFILHVRYIFIDSIYLVDECMQSSINIKEKHKFRSLDSTTCHMKDQHALTLPSTKTFKKCSARVEKMIRQIPWNHEIYNGSVFVVFIRSLSPKNLNAIDTNTIQKDLSFLLKLKTDASTKSHPHR